ncbi:SWI/SNF complex subunit SWI3C-like [Salvia divinorum]|uniref:SWI/SNF complex subunit SWI3C-like n=1 Tax=Salvia divinorum TaxID=28513 RepID=A0ABD1FX24_SALDI
MGLTYELLERNYPSINATIVHDLFLQSATSRRRRLMRDSIWIAIMKWDSLLVTLALILLKRIPRKIMKTWTGIFVHSPFCICLEGEDTESKFPFSSSGNPVMSLVAFLASELEPRVAAVCAHVSLGSLSKESSTEGRPRGYLSQHDAEGATLSAEKVISAAEDGPTAAAMKAKLFADHEEWEIQWLSANIINHQCGALPHSTATPPSYRLFGSAPKAVKESVTSWSARCRTAAVSRRRRVISISRRPASLPLQPATTISLSAAPSQSQISPLSNTFPA